MSKVDTIEDIKDMLSFCSGIIGAVQAEKFDSEWHQEGMENVSRRLGSLNDFLTERYGSTIARHNDFAQ